MAKAKRASKTIIGGALDAQFVDEGYALVWDNRVRMSAVEYKFFCNYLNNRNMALLYFGAVSSQKIAKTTASLHLLHSIAVDFLRSAAVAENEDTLKSTVEKKLQELMPRLKDSTMIADSSLQNIYEGLISTLCNTDDKTISERVENIYQRSVAASSVSFGIEEASDTDCPFRLVIACKCAGKERPVHDAASVLGNPEETYPLITASIRTLVSKSELIKRIYNDGDIPDSFLLSSEDLHTFLKEMEMYAMYGVSCKVPNRWKKHHASLTIGMLPTQYAPQLGAEAILNFDVNLSIDGEKLTDEEIQKLIDENDNLFFFRGKWVELKRNEMKSCLAAYESLLENSDGVSLADAMSAFLSPNSYMTDDDDFTPPVFETDCVQWLDELKSYDDATLFDVSTPSDDFRAVLRPYQIDGVRWLNLMRRMGFGACLSDDMGLGKTVQAIAALEQLRHAKSCQSLIVIPASLLQNWQDEIARFAPNMKYRVLHNSFGSMSIDDTSDVFITTYSMLSRIPQLKQVVWECIILDEAQAIKNPRTLQSKAAKSLRAKFRVAMTGTPIENSIADLWSIFDFLNPQVFRSSYDIMMSLADTDNMGDKLRQFVRPFLLRRLKTDKSIISDLPEKIEMKNYCLLTQRQAVLYKQVVNSLSDEIGYTRGIERRGLVLSGITRLKQICNHPDQYTGSGSFLPHDSGKMSRLIELCEEIKASHERVLVFTQFKEMCEPLSNALNDLFGAPGLVIHGSTSISERGAIVNRFNNPDEYVPYIVLSLRAGGVGLNLTAANHVIHFDRWWNPAVENQATDRAFRIGQKSNVIVHKLICTGTLEEKIDKLIDQKSGMATNIVESSAKLTELSDEELLELLHIDED